MGERSSKLAVDQRWGAQISRREASASIFLLHIRKLRFSKSQVMRYTPLSQGLLFIAG